MGDKVETRGVSIDYTVLARKGKSNDCKNGSKAKITEISVDEKYNSHTLKKSGRKGEGTTSNKSIKERNIFQDVMANSESKEFSNSNMVAGDAIDDEIIFQKEIHNKCMGNIHDNHTGSMMPVYMQYEVDGTKSKNTGRHVSHTPSMGGDGMAPSKKNVNEKSVAGKRKPKQQKQDKLDSDLEIIEEEMGSGSDVDGTTNKVPSNKNSLKHVDTAVPSSEDDLDLDPNNNTVKEMPHKVKNVPKENRKVVIRDKYVENSQPLNLKIRKNEVYSEIPVLGQGQVLAHGKPGKGLRILYSKI